MPQNIFFYLSANIFIWFSLETKFQLEIKRLDFKVSHTALELFFVHNALISNNCDLFFPEYNHHANDDSFSRQLKLPALTGGFLLLFSSAMCHKGAIVN